jgi:2-hydroxy-3-keto-5-methylthiopentenyl-1-phosphate phosphatase
MTKTAVQLDFDGTVTEEDISFLLLDTYTGNNWHVYLDEYASGDISVGSFNQSAFGMIRADEKTLTDFVLSSPKTRIRAGLKDFVDYCKGRGLRIIVVSNGLTFYIKAILNKLGISGLEIYAAENIFSPSGMRVRYLGPDSREVDAGFKESYTDMLLREGYEVIYVGNGTSDIYPSRKARYIFATEDLLRRCQRENLKCYPFKDFRDVVKGIQELNLDK